MPRTIKFSDDRLFPNMLGKIVCVGRNYAAHAQELNNPIPTEPLLFMKPSTAATELEQGVAVPESGCHYEAELAYLIGSTLSSASEAEVGDAIAGVALALDLTKREVQSELKEKGLPWEVAKAFDGSCPLSHFVHVEEIDDITNLTFSFSINEEQVQLGDTKNMLNPVLPLIAYISQHFTLEPGDVVLTGTPEGVGPLPRNASLSLDLHGHYKFNSKTR